MSAFEKEKIFVELREYHQNQLPSGKAGGVVLSLGKEFEELEDKIISMILSLVNGKLEYVELNDELNTFKEKIIEETKDDKSQDSNRIFYIAKIDHLNKILGLAEEGTFRLRAPRQPRSEGRGSTKVTTTR